MGAWLVQHIQRNLLKQLVQVQRRCLADPGGGGGGGGGGVLSPLHMPVTMYTSAHTVHVYMYMYLYKCTVGDAEDYTQLIVPIKTTDRGYNKCVYMYMYMLVGRHRGI